jgi:hypothetical protein
VPLAASRINRLLVSEAASDTAFSELAPLAPRQGIYTAQARRIAACRLRGFNGAMIAKPPNVDLASPSKAQQFLYTTSDRRSLRRLGRSLALPFNTSNVP